MGAKRCLSGGDERRAGGVYLMLISGRQVPLPPVTLRQGCSVDVRASDLSTRTALLFPLPVFPRSNINYISSVLNPPSLPLCP